MACAFSGGPGFRDGLRLWWWPAPLGWPAPLVVARASGMACASGGGPRLWDGPRLWWWPGALVVALAELFGPDSPVVEDAVEGRGEPTGGRAAEDARVHLARAGR